MKAEDIKTIDFDLKIDNDTFVQMLHRVTRYSIVSRMATLAKMVKIDAPRTHLQASPR